MNRRTLVAASLIGAATIALAERAERDMAMFPQHARAAGDFAISVRGLLVNLWHSSPHKRTVKLTQRLCSVVLWSGL